MSRLDSCALALGVALGASGCLVPGEPLLNERDKIPPSIRDTVPAELDQYPRNKALKIVFSEPMDPRSVIPGINLYLGRDQVPLALEIPLPGADPDPVALPQPWEVYARPAEGLLASDSPYTLYLRTILTDTAGNALEREYKVTFFTEP
jgi:hypothetical protein